MQYLKKNRVKGRGGNLTECDTPGHEVNLKHFTFFILCIIIQLLEFTPTNAHNFIKITITF